jgi:hypothetical protein
VASTAAASNLSAGATASRLGRSAVETEVHACDKARAAATRRSWQR